MKEKQLEILRNVYHRESNRPYESFQNNFYINSFMIVYFDQEINVNIENKNFDIDNTLKKYENIEYRNTNITSKYLEKGIKEIAGRKYSMTVRYQPSDQHTINARLLKALIDVLGADTIEYPENPYMPWRVIGKYGTGFILPINDTPQKELFYTI